MKLVEKGFRGVYGSESSRFRFIFIFCRISVFIFDLRWVFGASRSTLPALVLALIEDLPARFAPAPTSTG
jgi:hypothetical protein